MGNVLIQFNDAEKQAVRDAAVAVGMSTRRFIRRAAVRAAKRQQDAESMLAEVLRLLRRRAGGNGDRQVQSASSEPDFAVAALVKLGLTEPDARRKAAEFRASNGQAETEDVIRACLTGA